MDILRILSALQLSLSKRKQCNETQAQCYAQNYTYSQNAHKNPNTWQILLVVSYTGKMDFTTYVVRT